MYTIKDKENFKIMKKKVTELLSFDCSKYTDNFLERRFEVRLRKNNLDSYGDYLQILKKSKEEQLLLKKELTIHVTHFFRDKEFWKEFRENIISKITENKKRDNIKNIRIWSAGCSSGEEPISIAICLHEKLRDNIKHYNISII